MLAYVEKCGEGGRDRGMGPRSDSMAPKQQEVCVYDEKHSKHGNLEHPVGRTSRRAGVADGWAACAGRKEETLLIGASSHARRTHAVSLYRLCVGFSHAACRSGLKKGRAFYRLIHARAVGPDGMDRRQVETWSAIQTLRW